MSRALGRYELLRPLAKGGMAEVYLARRRAAGVEKWLVVKRIRAERSNDVRFLDMFVREARLSMSLAHQNIVPVFDFGRIDDQVFLAMERVEGRDLGSSLARAAGTRMSPTLAAWVAAECCQALDYAHHRKSPEGAPLGIVHRDVTPRNVLLSWSGEVKLTDFGIAALAGEATSKLLGTPSYMAPEQARSEPLDARADVYAIGLVLREMLTGQRARPGGEREPILEAAKLGTLIPWPEDMPATVEPLKAIVDRATALAADDRYPDARSMLAELDTFIVGERAARKAESPARQLAAWLDHIWTGDREDRDATGDGNVEGNHLVSFLDDGALDVIGTGTERSFAATAADDGATPLPGPLPRSGSGNSGPTVVVRASAQTAAVVPESERTSGQHEAQRPATISHVDDAEGKRAATVAVRVPASRKWFGLAIVGVTVTGALVVIGMRPDREASKGSVPSSPDAQLASGVIASDRISPDAGVIRSDRISPDAGVIGSDRVSPDAAGTSDVIASDRISADAGVDAGSGKSGRPTTGRPTTGRPNTGQGSGAKAGGGTAGGGTAGSGTTGSGTTGGGTVAAKAGSGAGSGALAPVTLRKVTVNATPWAYFTVDNDPTQHETVKTILLAPGKHLIHFSNPVLKVNRDVTIEVPPDRDTSHVERLRP